MTDDTPEKETPAAPPPPPAPPPSAAPTEPAEETVPDNKIEKAPPAEPEKAPQENSLEKETSTTTDAEAQSDETTEEAPEQETQVDAPPPPPPAKKTVKLDLTYLKDVIAFDGSHEAVNSLTEMLYEKVGKGWQEKIHTHIQKLPEAQRAKATEKADSLIMLETAAFLWEEAVTVLEEGMIDPEWLAERIQDYTDYLPYAYGEDGEALLQQLSAWLVPEEYDEEAYAAAYAAEYGEEIPIEEDIAAGISKDLLWFFETFIKLGHYYDDTMSRIGARCIRLGGIGVEQYPHFGYVLDLLKEIIEIGEKIENSETLAPLIEARYEGGRAAFDKNLGTFRKELEDGAEPVGTSTKLMAKKEEFVERLGGFTKEEDNGLPTAPPPPKKEPQKKGFGKGKKA